MKIPLNYQKSSSKRREGIYAIFLFIPVTIFSAIVLVYQPHGMSWQWNWLPSLGINLSVNLDGLSFLFAGLITGVGTLIQGYALAYLKDNPNRFSFHVYLTLFMLAMLGLVLSDNILLLFVFWELTTITSYLLIGFDHEKEKSRKNALQSLIITGAGGLALLAGLILLGEMANSYQINVIVEQASAIREHDWFVPSLILILLGAFTKSAQFPFHFWLPNAMAAPTPVSAYLHSATMVKAGVYLLARVSPVYADHALWFYALTCFGGFTALWCALLALKQTDLKLMLAYSTNVALGKLVFLIGIGSEVAITAALLFILAHSMYKAALFMVVGNIDKATGTRDIRVLSGLRSVLILSLIAAMVAALSKSGVPPLMGFLSKEYMYKAAIEANYISTLLLLVINITMVALAIALIVKPFFNSKQDTHIETKPVESTKMLWVPSMILGLLSVSLPLIGLDWIHQNIVTSGVIATGSLVTAEPIKLWQGVNLPLVLSLVTLICGYFLYRAFPRLQEAWQRSGITLPNAEQYFDQLMLAMMGMAKWQTRLIQHKRLSGYVLWFFVVLAFVLGTNLISVPIDRFTALTQLNVYEVAIALLLVLSSLIVANASSRLLAVSALGVIGFMSTLVFMVYSAPDVAKTLLLVETLMVIFVVLLMKHMAKLKSVVEHSIVRKVLHVTVASVIGLAITLLLIQITADPLDTRLPEFFAENSVPGGHGRNIVNVILVDFRAFDTFGEVIVVVIAGLAAVSLLKTHYHKRNRINSLIFKTAAHVVATLMLVFSFYLLLRGHNQPGGGFIGALIAVIGFALLMFAESPKYVRERLYFAPFKIALFGVVLSCAAGLVSLILGFPFLTGLWWKEVLPLGTPLVFDIGVYLAILGGVMGMLIRVNEELD